jgi:hypothetical protein
MPFLSLGLSDPETQSESLRENSATIAHPSQDLQSAAVADAHTKPASALPPEIEQLRQKLSDESAVKQVAIPLAASVDALSSSERHGVPTFSTFKFGYLPARGLLYSTIFHEVALFALFLLFTYGLPFLDPQKITLRPNTQDHLIYLPEVGGGTEGQKSPGAGQSAPQQPSAAPAHASKGFAYPGPQAILSDPPNPTNALQTIQHPLLVHPEPIKKLIPLPNIVQMAETRLPSDLVAPKAVMPQHHDVPQAIRVKQDSTTHREARWKVPVNDAPKLIAKTEMPKLPAAEQPVPEAPKIEPKKQEEVKPVEKPSPAPIKVTTEKRAERSDKAAAPPSSAQVARMEMHGKALEPLVSLSPMPLPPGSNAKIPNGEARGRFAIAPGGTLNPNSLTPGKSNGTPSTTPATGQAGSQSPNAATEVASNAGTGAGHNPVAGGGSGNASAKDASGTGSTGAGTGSGNTAGGGTGGTGTGKGRGTTGTGKGATSAPGRGAGTGSGGGSGSGTGSFPGITIQGGEGNPAEAPAFTVAQQTPYNMTVVSTASSGGGLEDFGVFDKERVFTVYVPMKRTPDAEDPTWTLQYSLLNDDSASIEAGQQVVAPSAVMREWPQVPADLEKKYAQRQVVIYAVVDKDGKVAHIAVKQTPDPRVSDAIVEALSKWVFRPAQLNGQPVAVKVLLGIPL